MCKSQKTILTFVVKIEYTLDTNELLCAASALENLHYAIEDSRQHGILTPSGINANWVEVTEL